MARWTSSHVGLMSLTTVLWRRAAALTRGLPPLLSSSVVSGDTRGTQFFSSAAKPSWQGPDGSNPPGAVKSVASSPDDSLVRTVEKAMLYISDLSRCLPATALSHEPRQDAWHCLPYETCDADVPSGTMICAGSSVSAPEVSLPLNVSGWHAVYVGYWNPHYDYDSGTCIRVRLDNDPASIRIKEPEPDLDRSGTFLHEAFVKEADLTGRTLVFSKYGGPLGKKAYLAYVKLVPLIREEVARAERRDTRLLQAAIDGWSFLFADEYTSREHVLDLVERYRDSDVGKVLWAFNYGDRTNYPSEVGAFLGDGHAVPIPVVPATNRHLAGEKVSGESLRELATKGWVPQRVVAEHLHDMGVKFDAMFRLAILGDIPPMRRLAGRRFLEAHPECRQVSAQGAPIEKASYAFPEVRAFMVSLIEEVVTSFEVDGVNLCFIRGPLFTQYEQPVLDDFQATFGEDPRGVGLDDPRLHRTRCRYLTQFVREVRDLLRRISQSRGKELTLSAMVYPSAASNFPSGFDVEDWISSGLIDSVALVINPKEGADPKLIRLAGANGCEVVQFCGYTTMHQGDWVRGMLDGLEAGADAFGIWDMDAWQDDPVWWSMARRAGHREDLEAFAVRTPCRPTRQLRTVGGYDVLHGLSQAVYSGG